MRWMSIFLAVAACGPSKATEGGENDGTGSAGESGFDDPCGELVESTILYAVHSLAHGDGAVFIHGGDGVSRYEVDAIGEPTWRTASLGYAQSLEWVDGDLHAASTDDSQQAIVSRIDAAGEVVVQTSFPRPSDAVSLLTAFTTPAGLTFLSGGGGFPVEAWWAAVTPGTPATADTSSARLMRTSGIAAGADQAWFVVESLSADGLVYTNELVRFDAAGARLATVPISVVDVSTGALPDAGLELHALSDGAFILTRIVDNADIHLRWFDGAGALTREMTLPDAVANYGPRLLELPGGDVMVFHSHVASSFEMTRIDANGVTCTTTIDPPEAAGYPIDGAHGAFDGDTLYLLVVDAVLVIRGAFG